MAYDNLVFEIGDLGAEIACPTDENTFWELCSGHIKSIILVKVLVGV
jgi:hypothetical protein